MLCRVHVGGVRREHSPRTLTHSAGYGPCGCSLGVSDALERTRRRGHAGEDTLERKRRRGHAGEDTLERTRRRGHAGEDTPERTRRRGLAGGALLRQRA